MLTLILIALFMVSLLILWLSSSPFYWKKKGVPYLLPFPLFGSNLPSLIMSLSQCYNNLYQNYPNEKFFGFHFFTIPALLLKDPNIIKDIFIKDFEYFSSSGYFTNVDHDPYGWSVVFLKGEAWKEVRSKLTNYFTPYKLRNTVQEYVDVSFKKLDQSIKHSVENEEPIEIDKLLVYLTTDVIMQAVYGVETDCFSDKSYFRTVGEKIFSSKTNFRLLISMIAPKLNTLLKIKILGDEILQFFCKLFKDVLNYSKQNKLKHELLQGMINMMEENQKTNSGKKRYFPDNTRIPEYNEDTISAQLMLLVTGGIESTAITMALFLYELAINQDIQDKCRQEVLDVLAETGTDIRTEDTHKLTYFRMTLDETLRKYPPFAIMPRLCTKRYKFRDSEVTIEPGTLLILPIKSIQWDPKHYPEPEKFLPERFSAENKAKIDPGKYLAWGLGPKKCLGTNFAKLEMLLVLSKLLNKYRFTLSSKTSVPMKFEKYAAAELPNPGVWVYAEPLKSQEGLLLN